MAYAEYLRSLLRPLGVYELSPTSYSGAQLEALGAGLDRIWDVLQENRQEALPVTAENWGLERYSALFRSRPAAPDTAALRAAICALLRISGDSFTLQALNQCLSGCGVTCAVTETGTPGVVEVSFPDTMGRPEGLATIEAIVADILPCHLQVNYYFRFCTWQELMDAGKTWGWACTMNWREFTAFSAASHSAH